MPIFQDVTTFAVGKRWFAVLALVLGAAVAVTLLVRYFRGPDRETYLARNEQIVMSLPRPRGAHEVARQMLSNEESWGEQFSHVVGYSTHVSYAVPNALTQDDIVHFYKQHLRGWHGTSWTVDRTLFACFDRQGATVGVATDGMELREGATRKAYEIAVTHQGGTCD